MRLIDKDDLGVKQCSPDIFSADYCDGWNGLIGILETAPTVDAVPVVRCKDCVAFEQKGKYPAGMTEYPYEMPYGYCYHWDNEQGMSPNQVDGNDFCSYGKRKVDENGRT